MGRKPRIVKREGYWKVEDGWAGHWNDLAEKWVEEQNSKIVEGIMSHFPDLFNGPSGEYVAPRPFYER